MSNVSKLTSSCNLDDYVEIGDKEKILAYAMKYSDVFDVNGVKCISRSVYNDYFYIHEPIIVGRLYDIYLKKYEGVLILIRCNEGEYQLKHLHTVCADFRNGTITDNVPHIHYLDYDNIPIYIVRGQNYNKPDYLPVTNDSLIVGRGIDTYYVLKGTTIQEIPANEVSEVVNPDEQMGIDTYYVLKGTTIQEIPANEVSKVVNPDVFSYPVEQTGITFVNDTMTHKLFGDNDVTQYGIFENDTPELDFVLNRAKEKGYRYFFILQEGENRSRYFYDPVDDEYVLYDAIGEAVMLTADVAIGKVNILI